MMQETGKMLKHWQRIEFYGRLSRRPFARKIEPKD
jgi:hypothetical protein